MKGKFNFKDLMVQRGEMFAVGGVLLLVAFFVFDAFGHNVLKPGMEPDDLRDDIDLAKAAMKDKPPPVEDVLVPVLKNDSFNPQVQPSFVIGSFEPRLKRGQPTFFSVESLRASAGSGSFAYKAEAGVKEPAGAVYLELAKGRVLPGYHGGEKASARASRWVLITGLIPFEKQQANFDSHTAGTVRPDGFDANKDVLRYVQPMIERAVVSGQNGAPLSWVVLSGKQVSRGLKADDEWVAEKGRGNKGADGQLKMDPRFNSDVCTSPLPKLLLEDWTEADVLHPPEISRLLEKTEQVKGKEPAKTGDGKLGGGGLFDERAAEKTVETPTKVGEVAQTVKYRLLRFFDYDVEPGKTYVYRVKLYMYNPNYGFDPRYLTPQAAKTPQTKGSLSAEWSVSPQATVPIASGVLAGVLKARAAGAKRDVAHMMVIDRNPDTGLEAHMEMTRRIGHLAHFPIEMDVARGHAKRVLPPNAGARKRTKLGDPLVGKVPVLDPLRRKIRIDATFTSDVALLDVRGGADGWADEILIMDGQGNLSAHHSADDAVGFGRRNDLVTAEGVDETPTDVKKGGYKNKPDKTRKKSSGFKNKSED